MTIDPIKFEGDSEVFRFGGFSTILLISLLAFIGLYPLLLGGIAGRLAGGFIFAVILVCAMTATRSRTHRAIGVALAFFAISLQVVWLRTDNKLFEAIDAAIFAIFFLYTALLMFRHVLSFGPVYADRVHAALSVYILLALTWAFIYGLIEIGSPGAFLLGAASADPSATARSVPARRHDSFQHRDADLDRLW